MGPNATRRPSRRCRASQVKVLDTVRRATATWAASFSNDVASVGLEWSPGQGSCGELSREVKRLLSECPSLLEEERLAWQSIKKLLPDSCKCQEWPLLQAVVEKLSREPIVLPSGYLGFCRREASKIFTPGWDESYSGFCYTTSPPLSGCLEAGRADGGSLGLELDQINYLDCALGDTPFEGSILAEAMVVQSAGKPRPLTKFHSESLLLKPLHKTLYGWISRRPWLLRGDVKAEALDRAGFDEALGGFLASGDYASATDNLPISVVVTVLEEARKTSKWIPNSVWEYAFRIVRPLVQFRDGNTGLMDTFAVTTGQMMGSYLSFPMLCVQNFLAFKWAKKQAGLRHRIPVLINGDDILFQSPDRTFVEIWANTVKQVGLEVEETKTSVSPEFGTLNSTLLRWFSGRLRVSPTLRYGMLRSRDYLNGLGKDFTSFIRGVPPGVAWSAGREFFKWHVAAIRRTGRLSADEWAFRGRLAWRLASIFGCVIADETPALVPPAPSGHDVQVPPELLTTVPKGALSRELEALNAAEMTSWKWNHQYHRTTSVVRYLVGLSAARFQRPPDVNASGEDVLHRIKLTPLSNRLLKRRFFEKGEDPRDLLFIDLLCDTQDFSEYEALPPYSSVEYEMVLANAPKEKP